MNRCHFIGNVSYQNGKTGRMMLNAVKVCLRIYKRYLMNKSFVIRSTKRTENIWRIRKWSLHPNSNGKPTSTITTNKCTSQCGERDEWKKANAMNSFFVVTRVQMHTHTHTRRHQRAHTQHTSKRNCQLFRNVKECHKMQNCHQCQLSTRTEFYFYIIVFIRTRVRCSNKKKIICNSNRVSKHGRGSSADISKRMSCLHYRQRQFA